MFARWLTRLSVPLGIMRLPHPIPFDVDAAQLLSLLVAAFSAFSFFLGMGWYPCGCCDDESSSSASSSSTSSESSSSSSSAHACSYCSTGTAPQWVKFVMTGWLDVNCSVCDENMDATFYVPHVVGSACYYKTNITSFCPGNPYDISLQFSNGGAGTTQLTIYIHTGTTITINESLWIKNVGATASFDCFNFSEVVGAGDWVHYYSAAGQCDSRSVSMTVSNV